MHRIKVTSTNRRAPRRLRSIHRLVPLVAILAMTTALAGCGSATPRTQVASLGNQGGSTRGASAQPSQGIPDPDGRPRESLDQTTDQLDAQMVPFDTCVFTEHNPLPKNGGYDTRLLAAAESCIKSAPLPAWQLDPTNPQSRAFIGRTVTCLHRRGYHAMAALSQSPFGNVTQSWTVEYSPAIVGIQYATEAAEQGCERAANE